MKRTIVTYILLVFIISLRGFAQDKPDNSKIDIMLIRGEFKKAIDTCTQILNRDTLNSEVYYKLGVAYQNLLSDDKSLDCYLKAAAISPDNNNYIFTVAKSYINKGRPGQAKPLLLKLCAADSMNWPYAYYLTSIFMQEGNYDESIKIYYRFYKKDYNNYIFTDKIGFAWLKKGDTDKAVDMFNRSLELKPKDTNAMKNLAYLYAGTIGADTALKLLSKGIAIDSTDIDLYVRRAAINYTISDFKLALNDYRKILSSGDSSVLNLKRAGISFAKTNQPKPAVEYLLKAYAKDAADYEIMAVLAQNYALLKDLKSSAFYYRNVIKILSPVGTQLGINYLLLAEVLKSDNQFADAINAYIKSQEFRSDNSVYMIIANLYDEKLNDTPKAIRYYELYLDKIKNSRDKRDTEYTESITKRIESLKKTNQPNKK
jgi:tetratricopeptide (TPR) repeat protein